MYRPHEEKKRAKLQTEPTLAKLLDICKTGSVVETKITDAKTQDGTTVFEKEAVKQAFYQEFKERWAASENPVPQEHQEKASSGQYGEELDREVTIEELNNIIKQLKPGKWR